MIIFSKTWRAFCMRNHERSLSKVSRTLRRVLLADESEHSAEMKVYQFICYHKVVSHVWE